MLKGVILSCQGRHTQLIDRRIDMFVMPIDHKSTTAPRAHKCQPKSGAEKVYKPGDDERLALKPRSRNPTTAETHHRVAAHSRILHHPNLGRLITQSQHIYHLQPTPPASPLTRITLPLSKNPFCCV